MGVHAKLDALDFSHWMFLTGKNEIGNLVPSAILHKINLNVDFHSKRLMYPCEKVLVPGV